MSEAASPDPSTSWTTLFLRNRYLLVLSLVVILVAGTSALVQLPRLEDPRIVNRNPLLVTLVPGASAERVEALVTEPLEESLQEVSEIKTLDSASRAGVSTIAIELLDAVDADTNQEIFSKIRDRIADAVPSLPPEALPPFFDDKRDPAAFTLILALTWGAEGEPQQGILHRLAEDLASRLRNVAGTELVRLYGQAGEEIRVTVDADHLAALGLSAHDVGRSLVAADSKVPAGALRGERADLLLEVSGELDTLQRVRSVPLRQGDDGSLVRVGDVAEVEKRWREPVAEVALVDGRRSVFVAARMDAGRQVDVWTEESRAVVDAFAAASGLGPDSGVQIDTVFEQAVYTNERLTELGGNLVAGAAVVMVVVFLMMGWRSALVVGAALPLTAGLTLWWIQISGGALHQMSIFGMIIALGLLIDNAIVTTDEVRKNRAGGMTPLHAVDAAVRHLFLPLLASTFTTILAFAPIVLLPGSAGDFVGAIGGSVIAALSFSFFVAMTITASLAGLTVRAARATESDEDVEVTGVDASAASGRHEKQGWLRGGVGHPRLTGAYRRGLRLAMSLPVAAMLVAAFLPASGFVLARTLGNEFFPPVDRDMFELKMWLPSESSIGHTEEVAREAEAILRQEDDVERVFWMVGGSFPTVYYNLVMREDASPHYAHAVIESTSSFATKRLIERLQSRLDERLPGVQVVLRQFGQGPPIFADVEYRIYGPSLETLQDLGEQVRLHLQNHPDVLHTQVTLPRGEPKLWLDADEDQARLAGLTLGDLAGQLATGLEGAVGGSVIEELEELPVRVRVADHRRDEAAALASMNFRRVAGPAGTPSGAPLPDQFVPLASLGDLELRPALGGIGRYDGVRTNAVLGYTRNGALRIDVAEQALASLEASGFRMPSGYRLEMGGAAEQDAEATGNLLLYVPVLVVLMISTLVLTFRSVRLAMLLGVVAVLSVGLGLLATWTMSFPVSFNTILGTLGLIGVAFNNSIVVLAAIRADDAARAGDPNALVEVVIGATRHIVSTTLTTIGGFLPLLLFVGGDFWPSLAIVLAGGVGGSMILALLFVPSAYVLAPPVPRDEPEDRSEAVPSTARAAEGVA